MGGKVYIENGYQYVTEKIQLFFEGKVLFS